MTDPAAWRCACGYVEHELAAGAPCVCGLNPLKPGSMQSFPMAGRMAARFLQDAGSSSVTPMRIVAPGSACEVLGVRAGDLGSVCGRRTTQILTPADADPVEVRHADAGYRFVRRGDQRRLPWLGSLIGGAAVYCVDGVGRPWTLVDAFTFSTDGGEARDVRLEFLLGPPAPWASGLTAR
jgi:hypothetical protein